ncbi:hypothetical protein QL285_062418 [Trifolium repens]|nr:hypothetical protein QL285_062418 [Trifolium repens]
MSLLFLLVGSLTHDLILENKCSFSTNEPLRDNNVASCIIYLIDEEAWLRCLNNWPNTKSAIDDTAKDTEPNTCVYVDTYSVYFA